VLTFITEPAALLERLVGMARAAMARTLAQVAEAEARWVGGSADVAAGWQPRERAGAVLTYRELRGAAVAREGEEAIEAALVEEKAGCPDDLDARARCLRLVRRLWSESGRQGPAVVVYFSPPYYPHVAATPCALHEAVAGMAAAHPELKLLVREFYPYISDMSYLRLDPGTDLGALTENMPTWHADGVMAEPGAYALPLAEIARLGMPVVNLGPYGAGAHQRGERLLMSYSFGTLPQLITETVERLGA
jgi:arginine utilization protein RocB